MVREIKAALILVIYGILIMALIPLLVLVAVNIENLARSYLTSFGASLTSLIFFVSIVAGALYLWLKIASLLTRRMCREKTLT